MKKNSEIRNSLYEWLHEKKVEVSKEDRKKIKEILRDYNSTSVKPASKKEYPDIRVWHADK